MKLYTVVWNPNSNKIEFIRGQNSTTPSPYFTQFVTPCNAATAAAAIAAAAAAVVLLLNKNQECVCVASSVVAGDVIEHGVPAT